MGQDMWLSETSKCIAVILVFSLGALLPRVSIAQVVDIGGQACIQEYAWYDYYTNGELTDSQYEPDGITCYDTGGGVRERSLMATVVATGQLPPTLLIGISPPSLNVRWTNICMITSGWGRVEQ